MSDRVVAGVRRRAGRLRRELRQQVRWRPELTVVVAGAGAPGVDGTRRCLEAQGAGRRLEVLVRSGGPVAALLAGGRDARGDHVCVLAAGDTVAPGWVSAVLAAARPDAAVLPRGADLAEVLRTLRGAVLPVAAVRAATAPDDASPLDETVLLAGLLAGRDQTFHRAGDVVAAVEPTATVGVDDAVATAERLGALPQPELAAAAVAAAVGAIDPGLRADAAARDAVRRRFAGLPGFDPASANHGLARDLAILYVSLPAADTAANIAARRVRERGALVDVVSADLRKHRGTDRSADPLWNEWLDEHVVLPGKSTVQGDWTAISRFCRDGAAAIAERERRKGPYRSVYSRTMFPGAHLLAARYKIAHPQTPWLAEFSDPQLINPRGETRNSKGEPDAVLLDELGAAMRERGFAVPDGDNVWEWCERVAYALADVVMFTNDAQRDFMLGYCADADLAARAARHTVVSHHPSPPAELYSLAAPDYALAPDRVNIAYFGAFYLTRTLTEVVSGLAGLAPQPRSRLRLHVFTSKPDALREEVAAAGVEDVVAVNGYLPFADYLALTTRFDVLLVNDYATAGVLERNPFLPAKYADYRASGTPVWGIVEPGSVLSGMPLAHRSDLGDVAGAAAVLERLAAGRETSG